MKYFYKRMIFWTLVIVQIAVIFSFSFQNAEQSSFLSGEITEKLKSREQIELEIEHQKDENGQEKYKSDHAIKEAAKQEFYELEKIIRKLAHAFLFFILEILIVFLICSYWVEQKLSSLIGVLYCSSIAFMDETIQLFSEGRAGLLTDVLIDTGGAILAALLFTVGGILYEKNKKKHGKVDCKKI